MVLLYLHRVLIPAAVIPAIFLLVKIYRADRREKEPPQLLTSLVFCGILATIALVAEKVGFWLLGCVWPENSLIYQLIEYFVIVAFAEEGAKYYLLKKRTWMTPAFNFTFDGVAAHAGGEPHLGRSALDAVELMNVGVQFLREHMPRDARIHYSILDAGGASPNVVQHQASVLYMIRSNFVKDCITLHQRVDKIAQGAALMTDTTIERRFVDGLSDTVCNHALEKVLYDNFAELGVPACTPEEHAFMEKLSATYAGSDIPSGVGAENDPAFAEKVQALRTGHFNDFLVPLYQGPAFNAGSTDVGDVSYQCPTAQIHMAVWPNHVPCHSWQVVSCNKTPLAHRATVHAGKVLCAAAIDLIEQPELLEQAKAEFRKRTAGGYTCPIPADAVPAPLD